MERGFQLTVLATTIAVGTPSAPLGAASGEPWRVHALVGARVVIEPGRSIDRATIVIRDGVIEAVGERVAVPADAWEWDLAGRTVYAGFLDPYVALGRLAGQVVQPEAAAAEARRREGPRETPRAPGDSHELASVRPELRAADQLRLAAEAAEKLRSLGFTAVSAVPDSGIFRGRAAVVSLGSGSLDRLVVRPEAGAVVAFEEQDGEYPDSLQGVIAVVRQTLLDARWHEQAQAAWARRPAGRERPAGNRALEALAGVAAGRETVLFDALADPLNVLRAARIGREFGLRAAAVATGGEYRRLDEVREAGLPLIVPLDFPAPPEVGSEDEWAFVSSEELRHWKAAPSNPRWLAEAGIDVSLTTARLKDPAAFSERLKAAVAAGLPRRVALAALTTRPAALLGVGHLLGTVERGKIASLVVAAGDPFGDDGVIESVWVEGERFETGKRAPERPVDPSGVWLVRMATARGGERTLLLELVREESELAGRALPWPQTGPASAVRCARIEGRRIEVELTGARFAPALDTVLVADVDDASWTGWAWEPGGGPLPLVAERVGGGPVPAAGRLPRPPATPPRREGGPIERPAALLVRNATVWTSGPAGVIEGADIAVENGRITAVGKGLAAPPGAAILEAGGRHVTPGLVDAHSHTAIASDVNECTQSVTAEVRIGDVVDPDDWNIYSELAGGLTAANQLHGSCNAIGGQSQTIKLRWGAGSEQLKLAGARPGIKFALGENVKQSNWGDRYTVRYPQTRMGVREVIRERFLAARDYLREHEEYRAKRRSDPDAIPPRTDLELEALAEVLRGERIVHCHSYRQSELLMMLEVAKELGITIGTFQHVLDGYKVADEIAAQGVGASTFSDWWAYKFEVYDAMPWNGALMWDRGVVVSFNSDSNEQARRLNTEAAKAVKYGGLPEAEALKLVTINPAMQLRIDDRIGSLEPGKDADFVLWSGHPLLATSVCEQTWIDGNKYFDRAVDLAGRREREEERKRLIAEAREAAKHRPAEAAGGSGYRAAAGHHAGGCLEAPMGGGR